jgi:hypothetical protein
MKLIMKRKRKAKIASRKKYQNGVIWRNGAINIKRSEIGGGGERANAKTSPPRGAQCVISNDAHRQQRVARHRRALALSAQAAEARACGKSGIRLRRTRTAKKWRRRRHKRQSSENACNGVWRSIRNQAACGGIAWRAS